MKKLLITMAAMSMALVACGGKSASSKTRDWSNEDKALMQEHLYGEILPYAKGMGKITVQYDDESQTLVFTGSKAISYDDLFEYLDIYEQSEDWHLVQALYQGLFSYEKVVSIEEQNRYVTISAGLQAEKEGSDEVFIMVASDPYEYEYPADYVAELLDYYYGSDVLPPEVTAERYLLNESGITCFGVAETIEADYVSSFSDLPFDVFSEDVRDDYGYRIVVAKDKSYSVTFKYAEDDHSLDIYFDGAYVTDWNDVELISNSLFTKYSEYGASYFLVPTVKNQGLFRINDNPDNSFYAAMDYPEFMNFTIDVIASSVEEFVNYLVAIENAGWNIDAEDEESYCYAIKDNHELEVEYDEDYEVLTLTIWMVPSAEEGE